MNKEIRIIGCGISGATLANILANNGWHVTIYDMNNFVGGNCYDGKNKAGILVHNFGPHIFHTNDKGVYSFVTKFAKLNKYVNKVLVSVKGKLFPLPINFKSIEVIMGTKGSVIIKTLKKIFPDKKSISLFELRKVDDRNVQHFLD
ncbi:MAG: NAD(P)-binding protein [Mycoplasmoidaceae bacterium]|nr:NAD(P)-binding protein [Mycoplasmoidaceae bacterium]